jgi:glycerol-3-phosphate dehydrogenase
MKVDYDVVIIGGGITGAGVIRDLALHGVKCLIVDKKDFSSQTSQSSSKMLHGGIRYLENFDFNLVWEALHEKNLWLRLTPHLCYETPFCLPVFKRSSRPLWMIKMGLVLYDVLSSMKNSPHKILSKKKTLELHPYLSSKNLRGSGVYYDAIMDDVKMTLEVIFDALVDEGNEAKNYTEVIKLDHLGEFVKLKLRDTIVGNEYDVTCKYAVFCTGPFTDKLMHLLDVPWDNKLLPSKGAHIWLRREILPIEAPIVIQSNDGRVIFVIPQEKGILVGTTETKTKEEFFDIKANQEDIDYLLGELKAYFPKALISAKDILSSFAGIRPLVKEDGQASDRGNTAREHKVFYPYHNTPVLVGGKYTTFRVMCQDVTRPIVNILKGNYNPQKTMVGLRQKSIIPSFTKTTFDHESVIKIMESELPRTFRDLVERRMGIPSKEHWSGEIGFDEFFLGILDDLNKHLGTSKEDIINY